jgi:hypothetical protein
MRLRRKGSCRLARVFSEQLQRQRACMRALGLALKHLPLALLKH